MPSEKSLHHLVCWNPDYVEKAVEKHLDVIRQQVYGSDDDGTVWWGKFRVPVNENGEPGEEYEPYGESKSGEDAAREVAGFKRRIRNGEEIHLYIHNPNPPLTECHVGHVVDIHYGESLSLPNDDQGRPACARIPEYYFHHKDVDGCAGCKSWSPKCLLKHECAYWFKLNDIKPNPHGEFYRSLLDARMGRKLNFAVTLLYPLLVEEDPPISKLFDHKRKIRLSVSEGEVPWKDSAPIFEEAERNREQAINQFIRSTFMKGNDLEKAEFFLNRYLLDDAAMYLSHRYELILNYFAKMNGDLERPQSNWKFIQLLMEKKRIIKEQSIVLGEVNDVRNHVYHGDQAPTQRKLLSLLQGLREFEV